MAASFQHAVLTPEGSLGLAAEDGAGGARLGSLGSRAVLCRDLFSFLMKLENAW